MHEQGDQASIVGGAINFVKELEQVVQSLDVRKRMEQCCMDGAPFAGFFIFPQYSTRSSRSRNNATSDETSKAAPQNRPALADKVVTMVDSHANFKVLSRRRSNQLLKMVVWLHNLRLTTLHLHVNAVAKMSYCFSLKVQ